MGSEIGEQEPTESRADGGGILDGLLPAIVSDETRRGALVVSGIRDVGDGRRGECVLARLAALVECRWRTGAA